MENHRALKYWLLLFFIVSSWALQAQDWQRIADLDITRRMYPVSFSINGKGYVGFGHDYNSLHPFNDLWSYDTVSNTWTEAAWFEGQERTAAFAFVYNGAAYIGGGSSDSGKTSLSTFFKYTPGVEGYQLLSPCPARFAFGSSVMVCGHTAYVIGGCNLDSCERVIYTYNMLNDHWDTLTKTIFRGKFGVSFMLDSFLYYGMPTLKIENVTAEFWKLNLRTLRWDRSKPIPGDARCYAVSCNIDTERAIVGLGFNARKYFLFLNANRNINAPRLLQPREEEFMYRDIWLYNYRSNKWRKMARMQQARRGAASFVIGDYLYIGMGNVENEIKTDFWRIKLNNL